MSPDLEEVEAGDGGAESKDDNSNEQTDTSPKSPQSSDQNIPCILFLDSLGIHGPVGIANTIYWSVISTFSSSLADKSACPPPPPLPPPSAISKTNGRIKNKLKGNLIEIRCR
jgi:hypothetical protein